MLSDVVIMRIGLIFLLICTHSFAPYSGSWEMLPNMADVALYKYISPVAHFISMPALIFISGYLFGHSWHRTCNQSFKEFVVKKFKRLIIPSVVFSLFYYYIFYDTSVSIYHIGYSVLNGCGHLWFLPMLFWCFVVTFLLYNLKFSYKIVIPILIVVSILPVPSLPLRLSSTTTYLIYFYIGSVIQTNEMNLIWKRNSIYKNILYLTSLTVVYFILQYIYPIITIPASSTLFSKVVIILIFNLLKLMLGLLGIGIAYVATRMFLSKGKVLPVYIITLSTYCYGIYIFHQFILKYLYYKTGIVGLIEPYALPWVIYSVTLVISIALSYVFLKNKVGRFLIG